MNEKPGHRSFWERIGLLLYIRLGLAGMYLPVVEYIRNDDLLIHSRKGED